MSGPLGPHHAVAGPLPLAAAAGLTPVAPAGDSQIWINGVLHSTSGPHVSAADRGLTLADGLFETMRMQRGRIFRLDAHLARLSAGLATLRIVVPGALEAWVRQAVQASGRDTASVRLTVTRGPSAGGLLPPALVVPTAIVAVSSMPAFAPSIYEAGLHAQVASGRRNERAMTSGLKTLAYADAVMALLDARAAGKDEALFLDTGGHWSEATASNLFVRIGDNLLTPPVACGALPGITRSSVMALAGDLGLRAVEQVLAGDDLMAAGEAFLTSSLRGVAPLVRVDDRAIGTGTPGEATRRMAGAYARLVERECGS